MKLCEWSLKDVAKQLSFLLLGKVLVGRQQQLELKVQKNREAQEESLRRREELIQELELEREMRRREIEQEEGRRTARMQEINAQVSTQFFFPHTKVHHLDLKETQSESLTMMPQ